MDAMTQNTFTQVSITAVFSALLLLLLDLPPLRVVRAVAPVCARHASITKEARNARG